MTLEFELGKKGKDMKAVEQSERESGTRVGSKDCWDTKNVGASDQNAGDEL